MSTQPGRTPSHPALPATWPSAWSSLSKNVLLGSILPVVAAVIVVVILLLTKSFDTAWWVALLPLLLLAWPLSLPGRVRKVMQDAGETGKLDIVQGLLGTIATARERRLGVRPNAEIVPGKDVKYFLNEGDRAPRPGEQASTK